jgi:hypothetical protein
VSRKRRFVFANEVKQSGYRAARIASSFLLAMTAGFGFRDSPLIVFIARYYFIIYRTNSQRDEE